MSVILHSSEGGEEGKVEREPCGISESESESTLEGTFEVEEEAEEVDDERAMPFSPRVRPRINSSSELSGCTVTS